MFNGKHILLGVTGGIAAYKVAYLVRELVKSGAEVRVVMTDSATKFVSPLTFSTLSGHEVAVDLWNQNQATDSKIGVRHIDLALWADLFLIAPATANTIAKLTHGISDNLLTVLAVACTRPVVVAPAMDADMFLSETTQRNLELLRERGYFVIPPGEGEHASGLKGPGRLPELQPVLTMLEDVLRLSYRDLESKKILVTAGPTHEPIDPVRYIGNRSTGKMGFALASAAAIRGASVTLVTGPVGLQTPRHVERVDVETAEQMHQEVANRLGASDVLIMAAAVADFTPVDVSPQKMKKGKSGEVPAVKLKRTTDILQRAGEARNGGILVGFALETENELAAAEDKLRAKNLDLIVLNSLREEGAGFGTDTNVVSIINRSGEVHKLPRMSKFDVANEILNRLLPLLKTS